MPKCSFCSKVYEFPYGLTLVLNDGKVLHFCSSKCRKNFELGRKGHKTNWVKKMKKTRAEIIEEIKEQAEEREAEKEAKKEEKEAEKTAETEEKIAK